MLIFSHNISVSFNLVMGQSQVYQEAKTWRRNTVKDKGFSSNLVPIMARKAASSADPSVSTWNASQAGEDRLSLHITIIVGTLLSLITSQHQIRLLGFPISKLFQLFPTKNKTRSVKHEKPQHKHEWRTIKDSHPPAPPPLFPQCTPRSSPFALSRPRTLPPSRAVKQFQAGVLSPAIERTGKGKSNPSSVKGRERLREKP